MGNKLAAPNNCIANEEAYIKKIEWRRRQNPQRANYYPTTNMLPGFLQELRRRMDYCFGDMRDSRPVEFTKQRLDKFSTKEWSSMISYLIWEKEFREVMQNEVDQLFNGKFESERTAQFMKVENNVLTGLLEAFDTGVVNTYEKQIAEWLKMTCPKYDKIGYKKKTPLKMVMFISKLDASEVSALNDPVEKKRCQQVLREILGLVKNLGTWMAQLIQILEGEDYISSKKTQHISTALILNCFLKFNFSFYILATYLSRILLVNEVNAWMVRCRQLHSDGRIFEDLEYINKFILNQKDQENLREFTRKDMGKVVNDNKNYNYLYAQINQKRMDMTEFLGHVNHHLKLNLDMIFFAYLSDVMFFFQKIEDFMDKIFRNAELEIKIDLIRVILRINDSTDFFYKIYLINAMDLDFLSSCQIFALFNQVLLCSELKVKCIIV